jgi:hypothetical protein
MNVLRVVVLTAKLQPALRAIRTGFLQGGPSLLGNGPTLLGGGLLFQKHPRLGQDLAVAISQNVSSITSVGC